MSDVKEVKVSLMPKDEKKLTPRSTSRKRRKGGAADAEPVGVMVAAGASDPTVFVKTQLAPVTDPVDARDTRGQGWLPTANVTKTAPNVEKLITPTAGPTAKDVEPPLVGGGVRLTQKKRDSRSPYEGTAVPTVTTVGNTPAPKILTTKRKSGGAAPAILATRKKARLVISSTPPLSAKANAGGARTRKFRERRISITVRPGARAAARRVRERVDTMPIAGVRRVLMRRGVLKPGAKALPEAMMRSMLKDYMLLHNAD
jgi:hypothetical protein